MNPNALYPPPDANSSSLAYLNNPPPGTNPTDTPDPNPAPPPPQLRNRAQPQRAPLNLEQDLMDIDTGTDTSSAAHDTSPDHAPERGLKRARPDTDDAEALEHLLNMQSGDAAAGRRGRDPRRSRRRPRLTCAGRQDAYASTIGASSSGDAPWSGNRFDLGSGCGGSHWFRCRDGCTRGRPGQRTCREP